MVRLSRGWGALAACGCSLLMFVAGCGSKGPKTHPVVGKVQIKDGDVAILTGSAVELKHESDEYLRPMGNIDSTGKFTVKTLIKGEILSGAPEGPSRSRRAITRYPFRRNKRTRAEPPAVLVTTDSTFATAGARIEGDFLARFLSGRSPGWWSAVGTTRDD